MRWKDLRESKKESIINEKEAAVKKNEEVKPEKKNEELKPQNLDLNSFEDEAPVLPQESEDDDTYDLQKELEAKFDELFGPIEDDDE